MSILAAAQADRNPTPKTVPLPPKTQRVCIDLPGEDFSCYVTEPNVEIMLRKHRDVVFDIRQGNGASYTLHATQSDFYNARDKKLIEYKKKHEVAFSDGERLHIWIGRNFKGKLILKQGETLLGQYAPGELDRTQYGDDPITKPEPMVVAIGKSTKPPAGICTPNDPFGITGNHAAQADIYQQWLKDMRSHGTQFDYSGYFQPSGIRDVKAQEYVVVTTAEAREIQPQVRAQLDAGKTVQDRPEKIFAPITAESALTVAADQFAKQLEVNSIKEGLGYTQEYWRQFGKLAMTVTIEKAKIGKYKIVFKGLLLKQIVQNTVAQITGKAMQKKIVQRAPMASPSAGWLDGGHVKTGRAGLGGAKRIILTASSNFKSGLNIQGIGTIIDLYGDIGDVFGDGGSKDFSELLGRAGVTFVKAGVTAALGSLLAVLLLGLVSAASLPALLVAGVVLVGYIAVATLVDLADDAFQIKDRMAAIAR